LHEIFNYLKIRLRLFLILLLAFIAGCLFTGLFLNRHRFADVRELEWKAVEHRQYNKFPYHRQTSQLAVRFVINDTILNTQAQQKLLDDLKTSLNESESTIANYENTIQEQEKLLKDLQARLNEMSEIYTPS